ncbi:MAG: SAM-dependent methyltransferase, partial [Rhodocyclaceae bacterium]
MDQTCEAVQELLQFRQPADALLSAFFRAHRCGPRERAFIAETGYALLRHLRSLSAWVGAPAKARQLVLAALLRHRGLSLRTLEAALPKSDAAWLLALKGRPESALTLGEQTDLPDWLVERLGALMSGDELVVAARALNQPAPLDLRVNVLKARREDVLARLIQEGIAATACPFAP